jgi:hypothetical protein
MQQIVKHRELTLIKNRSWRGTTPMTKNGTNSANSKQIVSVQSQDGENIGLTYPKRAAGLVKKGRARFVNDNTIRLMDVSDVTHTEDIKMDNINTLNENKNEQRVNRLLFNAREWSFNKDCQKSNVGNRSFMQGPDGNLAEAYTIGDWGYNWTEIVTKTLILPKNTTHTLTFWLNGGENDKNDEVCRFVVVYNNDCDNCYTYNLNRNFIKPLKKVNGWELYEIPFITGDNEYTQLRFVAKRAYMTVLSAKPAEAYADLPDSVDEFESERPQRHNIVFADGWPTNTWYSTRELRRKYGSNTAATGNIQQPAGNFGVMEGIQVQADALNGIATYTIEEITNKVNSMTDVSASMSHEISQAVSEALNGAGNPNDVDVEEICSNIVEQFSDKIENMVDEITMAVEGMTGAFEEMRDSLDDISEN